MGNIIELKGNWSGQGQSGDWKGRAILYEDGWFEGTVVDSNSPYQGDRLIFGIYLHESRIELLKHCPPDISDPFVFKFFYKENKWEGPFYVISYFGETKFGEATLEVVNESSEHESDLITSIAAYKEAMSDGFYEGCLSMRSEMIQALKKEMK
jgi:hypothetical protein